MPAPAVSAALGGTAEGVGSVRLLADVCAREGVDAPATEALAALVEGRIAPETLDRGRARGRPAGRGGDGLRVGSVRGAGDHRQGSARRRLQRAVQHAPARRLQLRYYRTGNHHDAEDLTEQTFLQAYRHFERAQRESHGRPLRPWLIRIAHNLAANYYRDRSRRPQTPLEDAAVISAPHDTEDARRGPGGAASRCWRASRALPDDRREALIMRFALGMDNKEIARALGRSEGATKVLLHARSSNSRRGLGGRGHERRREASAAARWCRSSRPDALGDRLERRLTEITDAAVDELAEWDPSALRDPRRWARLAAAGVVGAGAGGALVVSARVRGSGSARRAG